MKPFNFILGVSIFVTLFCSTNFAKAEIIENTTWTQSASPYTISEDAVVNSLVIEPGVRVEILGDYEIEVRVRDANGDQQVLVFSESWQRDDDQPVAISADYPIGEDVELIRLRSRGLRCACLEDIVE